MFEYNASELIVSVWAFLVMRYSAILGVGNSAYTRPRQIALTVTKRVPYNEVQIEQTYGRFCACNRMRGDHAS